MISIKSNKGFTLLELLIAVSLSSIVMVVLVGGFYLISKNWQAQDKRLDDAIDDSLIRMEIEKAILGAFPYTYKENTKQVRVFFQGNEHQLQFVSTMSPSYNNQLTIWSLSSKSDGGLSIQVTSALTGNPKEVLDKMTSAIDSKQNATHVLETYKVKFNYLKSDTSNNSNTEKIWVSSWDGAEAKSLPTAIRIELNLKNSDSNESDEIIAFILANTHQTIRGGSSSSNSITDARSTLKANPFITQ